MLAFVTLSLAPTRCSRTTRRFVQTSSDGKFLQLSKPCSGNGLFLGCSGKLSRRYPRDDRSRFGVQTLYARETPPPSPTPKEVPFELRGFSLAKVVTAIGAALTSYSLYVYFKSSGSASETSLTLIYGMPVLLLGLALWYAELNPVPVFTTEELVALRERKATSTLKQIIRDVTRHRYGDEAHLSSALRALRVIKKGEPAPVLLRLCESREPGDEYGLALVFECRETPFEAFQAVEDRIDKFFGSGIRHELRKISDDPPLVELKLVTCSSATADIPPTALQTAVAGGSNPTETPISDVTAPTETTLTTPKPVSAGTRDRQTPDVTTSSTSKSQAIPAGGQQTWSSSTERSRNPSESLAPFALFGFKPTPLPGPPRQQE